MRLRTFSKASVALAALAPIAAMTAVAIATTPAAAAAPMTSQNVVIIGGGTLDYGLGYDAGDAANVFGQTYAGQLDLASPTGDSADLAGISFSPLSSSTVSAATLAPYDTAVLNMASQEIQCSSQNLTDQAKKELVDWVASGKKLIIYDSGCGAPPGDYSWLPFGFTTRHPASRGVGSPASLTVAEENTLSSSNPSSPSFIDTDYLAQHTDAVGDTNMMTTPDPHWSIDMVATNVGGTGVVHAYARYSTTPGTSGLIIYNGLNQDWQVQVDPSYRADTAELFHIWRNELRQQWNPDSLPGSTAVAGISLTPPSATVPAGTPVVLTAHATQPQTGVALSGVPVTFTVLNGATQVGQQVVTTGADGTATFTDNSATAAVHTVTATFLDTTANQSVESPASTVTFQGPTGPTCNGRPATIVSNAAVVNGTPGDDVIVGGPANQLINGLGGNDTICGGDGNDVLLGGNGNDWLDGQGGMDAIVGGAGNDVEHGGAQMDVVGGVPAIDPGQDQLFGDGDGGKCFGVRGADTFDPSCQVIG